MKSPVYSFCVCPPDETPWNDIENCVGLTIFQTHVWNSFLSSISRVPIIVCVNKGSQRIGYFIGVKRTILGIPIIGAPIDGTGTYTQGLVCKQSITKEERILIYKEISDWLIQNRYAIYIQISDWQLKEDETEYIPEKQWHNSLLDQLRTKYTVRPTYFTKCNESIESLWHQLSYKSCKYCINKATKEGLYFQFINKVEDIDSFVDIHYKHILDVCHRKGMHPKPYQKKKNLLALCKSLFPNNILLVQVLTPSTGGGICIASAIFCYNMELSTYFTGASFHEYMNLCPNEVMVWEAIKELHNRGVGNLIYGGTAQYKRKFSKTYAYVPMIFFSKYKILLNIRGTIKKLYSRLRKIFSFK